MLARTFAIFLTGAFCASISQGSDPANCVKEALQPHSALEITTPEIEMPPDGSTGLPAWWYGPMRNRNDHALQGGIPGFAFINQTLSGDLGQEVVEVSNERFKSAPGWGQLEDWLAERLNIANAPEYRERSRYWVTRPALDRSKPIRGGKIETTYGMTWGEYSREDLAGKTDEEIYKNTKFRLPQEKTLQRPIHRYLDSSGKGIAIEFRAVSKDPVTTPSWLRDDGLNQMILGIIDVARRYPELYDKPVVTCYADESHIQLYEHWMNMKVQKETTPLDQPLFIHRRDGTVDRRVPWWYIEVSPRELERVLVERTRAPWTFRDLNQPHPFKLRDGREIMAAAKAPISVDANRNVTQAVLERPTELETGIVAEKGATAFWVDRHLVRVSALGEPATFELVHTKVVAPSSSALEWDHPFLTEWRNRSSRRAGELVFRPDFDKGDREFNDYKHLFYADAMHRADELRDQAAREMKRLGIPFFTEEYNRRLLDVRGPLVKPKIARVVGSGENPILLPELGIRATEAEATTADVLTVRLAQDFLTKDGLKASAGSDLVLFRENGKWIWTRIALSEDRVLDGIPFKKGMLLIRYQKTPGETWIRAYDGPQHFKDYPVGNR